MQHLMTVMNKHKDLSSPHRDQRRGLREPRPPLRSYLKTSDESLHPELSAAAEMTDPKGQQVQPASPQAPSHPAGSGHFPSITFLSSQNHLHLTAGSSESLGGRLAKAAKWYMVRCKKKNVKS